MTAYEIIKNESATNFISGSRYFMSSYDKVRDLIFKHDAKFFVRNTDMVETPEELKIKLSDNSWETVKVEYNDNELTSLFGGKAKSEYYHVIIINID